MSILIESNVPLLIAILLVSVRIFGIVVLLPQAILRNGNWLMRLAVALVLASVVAPSCQPDLSTVSLGTWLPLAFFREIVIGIVLGVGVSCLLFGVQIAGQLVSQMAGHSLAGVFDQEAGTQLAAYTRFLDMVAATVFLVMGVHRLVVGALLRTFVKWPLGSVEVDASAADTMAALISQSCMLGVQAALPILATLLVSNILAGMLGRIMPQMNVLLLSSGLNSILLMASVLVGLGVTAWTLQDQLPPMVAHLIQLCSG